MTKTVGMTEERWGQLEAMLQFKPTLKLCADYLGVGTSTITDAIRIRKGLNFTEYREEKMAGVKLKLQQKAIQMAMSGNTTMMIFTLKNLCKWQDNPDAEIEDADIEFV